ncbi:MAG: DUF3488 domain-containing protein [Deltaproteobacteria bacterium]|uniref:DUF3488 domain-containing protein n=1 Tax=Candidatus Zymogenus saltonus TaxID=2844893 RepID=A0A9D8KE20_9DELT|nr:DUF3488 domain-containing protein [Candidatus Zymogenus saltonus]
MEGLRRTFKILTFAVCTSGFAAMLFTGELGLLEHAAIFSSLIVGWFWGERLSKIPRAAGVATASIIAILFLSVIGLFFFHRSFVTTTISFLIYVQAVRILFLSEMRHHLQVYMISLASVLAATILTFSPLFLLSFLVYLFLATGTMITYNFIQNIESNNRLRNREDDFPVDLKGSSLLTIAAATTSFILIFSAFLFIFFPRISAGFLPSELVEPVRVSGFSKNVELGEVGSLKVSSAVVMRVVVDKGEMEKAGVKDVYLRGTAFDVFDGRYWEKTDYRKNVMRRIGMTFISGGEVSGTTVNQEFFLEPTDGRVLFSMTEPVSFEGPFFNLLEDRYGTVETRRFFNDKLRYRVRSVINPVRVKETYLTPGETKAYLQLPGNIDGRIRPLVDEITEGAETDEIEAERIKDYLLNNLSYDLDPGDAGDDPLAAFLFVNKKGYCEHFATAMVMMLRSAGIRSRLVTGFLAGDYNEYGSFYTVRASDAHAWVEAYFKGKGWVTLDPTPPAGLVMLKEVSAIGRLFENLKMKWNIYIVNYEMIDQMEMIKDVRDISIKGRNSVSDLREKTGGWISGMKEEGRAFLLPIIGVVIIFIVAIIVYVVVSFVFSKDSFSKRKGEGAVRAYLDALNLLSKKGVSRDRLMTPGEFGDLVKERLPDLEDDFSSLNGAYLAERFGDVEPYGETTEDALRSLANIRERLKWSGGK